MFYRRKILLALVEAFGGSLMRTDCQKLLFLFCLRRGKNYYDFFPYKYGSFSFLLYHDKNRLIELGYLKSQDNFQLSEHQTFLSQLRIEDRAALQVLVAEVGDLSGEKLIRKAYLECPYYASRSKIASQILKDAEYEQVRQTWNIDRSSCLFTIGYEGLSIDAYLNVLLSNNVAALIDVRKNPISMKYGFSKTKLADYTTKAGIVYLHIPDLGIPSSLRQDLSSPMAYRKLFDYYFSQILPDQMEAIEKLKMMLHDHGRVALTCFEANHQFCHRHKIIEYLENDPYFNTPVTHLNNACTLSSCVENNVDVSLPPGLWTASNTHTLVGSNEL